MERVNRKECIWLTVAIFLALTLSVIMLYSLPVYAEETDFVGEKVQLSESADATLEDETIDEELPEDPDETDEEILDGLVTDEDGNLYYYVDGDKVSGLQEIDGVKYYFDEESFAAVTGLKTIDGKQYYFDDESRTMITGQKKIGKYWYYFNDKTGAMVTKKWMTLENGDSTKRVYYQEDGSMAKGKVAVGSKYYYFDPKTGARMTGKIKVGDDYFYFDTKTGVMTTDQVKIGSNWYYFDTKTGAMVTGWKYLKDGNKTVYYSKSKTSPGRMLKGLHTIGKYQYYLDPKTGARTEGWVEFSKGTSYFGTNGRMWFGEKKIDGSYYYLKAKTGYRYSGWKTWSSERKVYYKPNGVMATGQYKVGSYWYYFNTKNGARYYGWKTLPDGDGTKKVYYGTYGKMVKGSKKIDGNYYYFNKKTGARHTGWLKLSDATYYYNSKGHRVTGLQQIDGKYYSFASNGKLQNYAYPLAAEKLNSIGWSLQAAYNWATAIRYVNSGGALNAGSNWYATYGFTYGVGDCYVKAAVFYQMARQLGYSANQIVGYVPRAGGGQAIHSWVEVYSNGGTYVVDPDFAYETGRNGYMFAYGTSGTWRYSGGSIYGE